MFSSESLGLEAVDDVLNVPMFDDDAAAEVLRLVVTNVVVHPLLALVGVGAEDEHAAAVLDGEVAAASDYFLGFCYGV